MGATAWAAGPGTRVEEPRASSGEGPAGPGGQPPAGTPPGTPPTSHRKKDRGGMAFLRELPVLIVIAFLLALLIKTFLVQAFYIPSGSMEPTLEIGDRVLVNKLSYRFGDPERGDVIVFENPNPQETTEDEGWVRSFLNWVTEGLGISQPPDKDFIKRVIGLPGETVEQRDGVIYIDGKKLDEPWLPPHSDRRSIGPWTVPDGHYMVMGDNRPNSNDSRFGQLGMIPSDKIVGKAFVIIWPPSRWGWLRGG
jgi:signal peptidase I